MDSPRVFIVGINGRVAKRHSKAWTNLGWDVYGCGSNVDYHETIKDKEFYKIDLIDICTPIYLHKEMIEYATSLGYPVICEKPMASTLEDAKELLKLQGKIGIVYQFRLNPVVLKLKKEIESGKYGEIKLITMNYFRWRGDEYYKKWEYDHFKAGGGVAFNVCIHYYDLLQWIFGYPTEVKGYKTTSKLGLGIEDNMVSILKFPTGAIASVTLSTHVNPPKHFEFSVYGTKGYTTVQIKENEYHEQYFKNFLKGEYIDLHEAYKSFKIVNDLYYGDNPNNQRGFPKPGMLETSIVSWLSSDYSEGDKAN
jgi:UDP-N-acetyl-2-amino-2-deoxyglucuronate dehydrogenase